MWASLLRRESQEVKNRRASAKATRGKSYTERPMERKTPLRRDPIARKATAEVRGSVQRGARKEEAPTG